MVLVDIYKAIMEFSVPITHASSLSFDLVPPRRPNCNIRLSLVEVSVWDSVMDLGFVTEIHLSSKMGI